MSTSKGILVEQVGAQDDFMRQLMEMVPSAGGIQILTGPNPSRIAAKEFPRYVYIVWRRKPGTSVSIEQVAEQRKQIFVELKAKVNKVVKIIAEHMGMDAGFKRTISDKLDAHMTVQFKVKKGHKQVAAGSYELTK